MVVSHPGGLLRQIADREPAVCSPEPSISGGRDVDLTRGYRVSVNRHALSLGTSNLACQVHRFHAAQNPRRAWGRVGVYSPAVGYSERTPAHAESCVRESDDAMRGATVDTGHDLTELKAERGRLSQAIAALEGDTTGFGPAHTPFCRDKVGK